MSNTNFHKESWNPLWNIDSILKGFLSFFLEDSTPTYGSMSCTQEEKKKMALKSSEFNLKTHHFTKLFPEMSDVARRNIKEQESKLEAIKDSESNVGSEQPKSWDFLSIVILILILLFVIYVSM